MARSGWNEDELSDAPREPASGSALRVSQALDRLGIRAKPVTMPASTRSAVEAAAAVGCELGQIVKSLVFRAVERDEPILVLVAGTDRVDESRLALVVGSPVERASAEFVRARTGYAIGGVPPVGHEAHLVVYLDEHLLEHGELWAAGGTPRTVFPITPDDLLRATSAAVVTVAEA